jgi:hypothetical protein
MACRKNDMNSPTVSPTMICCRHTNSTAKTEARHDIHRFGTILLRTQPLRFGARRFVVVKFPPLWQSSQTVEFCGLIPRKYSSSCVTYRSAPRARRVLYDVQIERKKKAHQNVGMPINAMAVQTQPDRYGKQGDNRNS